MEIKKADKKLCPLFACLTLFHNNETIKVKIIQGK